MASITAFLTEPASETMAPSASAGAISAATAPQAPTGMQRITRSAPSTASDAVAAIRSQNPSSADRARVASDFA